MEAERSNWYVARTRHGAELSVRNRLSELGVENFVPTRRHRAYRGRTMVEEPLLTSLVFLKATRTDALDLIHFRGIQADYMFDCATRRLMVVPEKQMEDFRRVFSVSTEEGGLMDQPLEVGERVRVIRGALRGVEGYVLELLGKTYVVVSLLNCLYARASVPRAWLEKVKI